MAMQHVTLRVRDAERSVRFYEEIVGLHVTRRLPSGPIFLAEGEGDCSVELIESADGCFEGRGVSIGFHVADVKKKREELLALGLEPTPITSPNPSTSFFFISDPDGLQIQFI